MFQAVALTTPHLLHLVLVTILGNEQRPKVDISLTVSALILYSE